MTALPAATLNDVYADRNRLAQLAAYLAVQCGWRAGFEVKLSDAEWPVLYIDLPTGQVSWHIPRAEELPAGRYEGAWDGHDNTQKAHRIMALVAGQNSPEGEQPT